MTELELKKYSRNALLGSFVSMLTAGLATMMYSVCISTIRTDLALTAVQAGSLGTYTFMGQMLGGMVAGYLADRFGRKNILIVDVILATLAVFATSLLQSYSIFGLLRFVTGVGLGGCYYIASILIGEFVPTNKRGFMSGVATSVWNFGYVVCCAMSAFALPSIGWRWCFRICALPIIFVIFMIFGMKDAPSFTAAKANRDKRDQAEGKKVNAYAEIWAHPRMRKSFIIWSISMILYFYGYYGLITWLPNYVQSQVGMQSGGWITAAGYIAMIIGTAGGGKIADKIGHKKALPHRHHRHGDLRPVPGLLGQQQQHPRAHAALRRLLRHAHRHPRDVHRRVLPDAPAQHRRRLHVQHRPSGRVHRPHPYGQAGRYEHDLGGHRHGHDLLRALLAGNAADQGARVRRVQCRGGARRLIPGIHPSPFFHLRKAKAARPDGRAASCCIRFLAQRCVSTRDRKMTEFFVQKDGAQSRRIC